MLKIKDIIILKRTDLHQLDIEKDATQLHLFSFPSLDYTIVKNSNIVSFIDDDNSIYILKNRNAVNPINLVKTTYRKYKLTKINN